MSQLMLISGLEDGVKTPELVNYLKAKNTVQNVWMDPYGEARVVVLCDKKLDLGDIKIKSRYLETAKPTASVFVKTHKCVTYGAKDKLKYLFTSQRYGGRKVVKVEQLNTKDDDCFELFFLNWDDVLKICNGPWKVAEQTLTVIPFFDSFKESFKQQLKRLIDFNNTSTQAKRSLVSEKETVNRPSVMLNPSDLPRKESFQGGNASVGLKSAKPVLEHPYILTLLHLLKFEHAVQQKYNMVTVTICESNWEVEIKGPVASLKIIQKLLTEEDELDHPTLIERFLGNKTALQDLKNFIDSAGLYVDIVDTQAKPFLQVRDGAERKETFHDFIFTLVISKECSSLPSRECQQQEEWTKLLEGFDRTYTHQQIFVEDTSVTLVCLTSKSQETDFIVNIINNIIIQLTRNLKPGSHQNESVPNPDQKSSQSSGNTTSLGGKENPNFNQIIICTQNSALLWILNILNLKNSLRQKTNNLDVDIDEDDGEITISGSKDLLQKLKSVLTMEEKKFQFTENEKTFLCDSIIRKSLNSCLITHGCCIVLSDDLEMSVARKDGHEAQFRHFLASFIQFKTVSRLPEKYQQTKEWNSLVEHCKNNYPHHHILTAEDQVYLLSIAPDETNTAADSIFKKVDTVIKAFTSPGLPDKHLSLAEEIGDQKCEEIKTDSGKISASDKSSRSKLTLDYKHPVLIRILQTLQLKEAAQKLGICVTMPSDHEIIIEGSKKAVKSFGSVLIKEDEMPFEDEDEFLTDEHIQQSVDSCLKASKAHLVLDDNLELFVVTKSGEKAQFRHFLASFIQLKTVSHLPEKYQQTKEWNSLVEHCKNNYPDHHILTAEDQVYLLSIAPDENNTDAVSILKKVDTVISAFTSPGLPEKHLSLAEEIGDQKCEEIKTDSGKTSASDKSSRSKLTLLYKHPVLIRILQTLQLKEAAQKFGICVTMPSDHEIIIEGSKKAVKSLQSALIKEDNEVPFEDEEEFLTDEQIQQNVDSCLKASKAHLVLDDNLELFVVPKSGEKAQFRHFLASFIQFKTVSHLPEKYQQTKEWNSLVEHCKNNYPDHHILTAEDQVYLLSIAPDENNTDAVSILKKVDTVITAFTSPGLPEKHLSLAEEIGDQKCEEIKTDSGKTSASDKSSRSKLTLDYKHPVLIRILQTLQLKEAAQKLGICVTMPSDHEIIIEGSKKAVKSFGSVLIKEDEVPFEDEEEFLTDEQIQQNVDSCLKASKAHLVLDDNLELFVVPKSGEKERFRAFFTRFIQFRKCAHFPEKYQNDKTWKAKLQKFEEQNPHQHIFINGEEVHLLTISSDDKSHEANSVMERINKAISDSCSPEDSDMSGEDECHEFFIKCPKVGCLHSFLMKEFQDEYDRWQNCRLKVTFVEDGIWISSSSHDATKEISSKLQDLLSTIKYQTKDYNFPGLSTYLNSTGKGLINKLSDQYRCLIEVPDRDNSHPQYLSLNEEQSSEISQGRAYKVIFLGTANCDRFNIHLVQGDMNDLNLEMKIQLQPSEEVESCEVRSHRSSQNVVIRLPLWSATNENLRSSFHDVISVAFDQAKHLGHNDIAFSTAQLTNFKGRFPPSVIAKGIIEMLFEQTGFNLASSQTENAMVDIYICDPDNEAVFKAFEFFLKLRHVIVKAPSQFAWEKVCFPDSYTYPDFNHFKSRGCQIEVSSNIPFSVGNNACVFYPINPSFDITTCPAIKEHSSAERSLKSSLSDLQYQKYPDGLIPGDIAPLKGFPDSRHSFVYCSPNWGMDSDKVIENLLEECIENSTHYEVTYIVPPGVQMLSKYPVEYLVQIFFRKLDNIAQSTQLLERNRRLVMIVQDPDYRQAFDQELKKRYPSKEKKGVLQTIWSYLWSKDKESSSYKNGPKTITKESFVPRTVITFVSTSDVDNQNAAKELEKQLICLMKEHSKIIPLNKQETKTFQNLLQNISSDILIKLSIKEWYEIESTHKNTKRSHNAPHTEKVKLKSSSLKINGLCQIYLDEFMIEADLIRDTEKDIKKKKTESAQGKSTTPLKNSTERPENVVGCEDSSKQQEKDSSKWQGKDSSKWQGKDSKQQGKGGSKRKKKVKLSEHDCASNDVSVQCDNYQWLWEAESDGIFQEIGTKGGDIEAAYSNKQKDFKPPSGKFTFVDFTSMTVHKNQTKTGIIRMDILDAKSCSLKKKKIENLKDNSKEFKQIESQLDAFIGKNNLSLVEVCKVERDYLHTRFDEKSTQLKHNEHSRMWHRILSKYTKSVCRYGFHPRFSGMPDASHLGEGVLFYKEPDKCFNPEMEKEKEIHLVFSKVLLGRSGPGAPGLRCPPLDEATNERFDSVSEDEAYMIFSDAQAYPDFMVTLQVK